MKFKQYPIDEWPPGLNSEIAMFELSWRQLQKKGLSFERSLDQLDWFRGAIFDLDGSTYALTYHLRAPVRGSVLWVMDDAPNPGQSIRNVMRELEIQKFALLWIHPDLQIAL